MKILLKNAKIFAKNAELNGKSRDIFIENGQIRKIGKSLEIEADKTIESENLCVSPGWMDIGSQTGDPGLEHREDLNSICKAAAAGGFTEIAPFPNTNPCVHSKSGIEYILNRTKEDLVTVYPIGAVTENCAGAEITEMYDMRKAGAIAFSDGKKSIENPGILLRALQYVKPFEGVILQLPFESQLARSGQMHEGKISTLLGMKGIPAISESIMVNRDLRLLAYTDSRMHFAHISSEESIDQIREAKKQGLKITASVPYLNLVFTDADLMEYNTNLKVFPPLREENDISAIVEGLTDGTIDFISSNHISLDIEANDLEFPYAKFGAIGLESLFAATNSSMNKKIPLELIVEGLYASSRALLNIDIPEIAEGNKANITLFDPSIKWTFKKENIYAKSGNSPFVDYDFVGKVLGVINNNCEFVH